MDNRIAIAKLNNRLAEFHSKTKKGHALVDYLYYISTAHADLLAEFDQSQSRPSKETIPAIIEHDEGIQAAWKHLQLLNNYFSNDDTPPEEYAGDFTDDVIVLHEFILEKLDHRTGNSTALPTEKLLSVIPNGKKHKILRSMAIALADQEKIDTFSLIKKLKGKSKLTRLRYNESRAKYNGQVENRFKTINKYWQSLGYRAKFTKNTCEIVTIEQ